MKKTGKSLIALLAVTAMLLSFAACGKKTNPMAGIFEKLQTNADYVQWKSDFSATAFEETLDGNAITVKATGDEGVNGTFVFTLDGDYIVATAQEGDYSTYSVLMFLKGALADYYGMNNTLMSGYLAGLGYAEKENPYFTVESAEGKTTYKLYAASAWKMEGLDEMVIDEQALAYTDPLTEDFISNYINCGKLSAAAFGSKDDLTLIVGEYGESTDLTLQSLQNLVAKLQPSGYEAFAKDFTALKEAAGNGYRVSLELNKETAENNSYTAAEGYSYVTVWFNSEAGGSSEETGQNPVTDFAGTYTDTTAGRCTITIEADGDADAVILVHWGSSATESSNWTMHGSFDPDTQRINYADAVRTDVVIDGETDTETVVYENGVGRIQFFGDGTLAWQDEQEVDNLIDMTFALAQ